MFSQQMVNGDEIETPRCSMPFPSFRRYRAQVSFLGIHNTFQRNDSPLKYAPQDFKGCVSNSCYARYTFK